MSSTLALALMLFARPARADTPSERPGESERRSVSVTLHGAPFESFPRAGLSVDWLHHFSPRIRLGARGTYYVPSTDRNVRRNALLAEVVLQGLLLDTRKVGVYVGIGVGIGRFHDDYIRVYDDVTRLSPGLSLESGVEVKVTRLVRPFLGLRAHAHVLDSLTDTQWLECTGGARFVF